MQDSKAKTLISLVCLYPELQTELSEITVSAAASV